jgi:tetratricopeptide (TPR) repeat protein
MTLKSFRHVTWDRLKTITKACISGVAKLGTAFAVIAILILTVQGIFSDRAIRIEFISVPNALHENGYTSDVASKHLRDALFSFAKNTHSSMHNPSLALRSELPEITVPQVGVSVDSLVAATRELLHFGTQRKISGEFTTRRQLLWLRLRIDGREVYNSPNGAESPDDLLVAAVPAVLDEIQPYLVAAALYLTDREQALLKARSIIARMPISDENVQWSYILMGNVYGDRKEFIEAEENYRTALKINSNNATAHSNLGLVLMGQGKVEQAFAEYELAMKIDPLSAVPHNNLGLALSEEGKIDAAIAEFNRAIDFDPKLSGYHDNLGIAMGKNGRLEDAIVEFRRAMALDPKDANAHYNLGLILMQEHNSDDAIVEYLRAIEIDPNNAQAHYSLAIALRAKGKFDEAIREYNRAIKIDPNSVQAHNNLGNLLRDTGKLDDAIAEYHRAIAIDPKNALLHINLAVALRNKGKLDDAIGEYKIAIEIDPRSAPRTNDLTGGLHDRNKLDSAIAEYFHSLKTEPPSNLAGP